MRRGLIGFAAFGTVLWTGVLAIVMARLLMIAQGLG
jgi:hypothetical protein